MRALGEKSLGKPSILEILEVPKPQISGPEDILVRVKAIRISPGDGIRATGLSWVLEGAVKYLLPLPPVFHPSSH